MTQSLLTGRVPSHRLVTSDLDINYIRLGYQINISTRTRLCIATKSKPSHYRRGWSSTSCILPPTTPFQHPMPLSPNPSNINMTFIHLNIFPSLSSSLLTITTTNQIDIHTKCWCWLTASHLHSTVAFRGNQDYGIPYSRFVLF